MAIVYLTNPWVAALMIGVGLFAIVWLQTRQIRARERRSYEEHRRRFGGHC